MDFMASLRRMHWSQAQSASMLMKVFLASVHATRKIIGFCVQYCKEALRNFFERFLEVFEPWTPTESTVSVTALHDAVHAAVGCKAGHPSSTLAAIVEAVERISTDFGRGEEPYLYGLHSALRSASWQYQWQ